MKIYIYKLQCLDSDVKEIYVGSTNDIDKRKANHKSDCHNENNRNYKFPLYQFIRANGGWDSWELVLIDEYEVEDEIGQHIIEQSFISAIEPELNNKRAYRTEEEQKEYGKEYTANNKEEIKEYFKERYVKNKEIILAKQKEKINCECGSIVCRGAVNKHKKTKKHQNIINTL